MKMKKKAAVLLLLAALALGLMACAPDYTGDERLGLYENGEGYTLVLEADGKGTMTYTSSYGILTEEAVVFDFEKDGTLVLHGTEEVGGVVGRTEFYGRPQKTEDGYTLTLRAVDTGVTLAPFVKTK